MASHPERGLQVAHVLTPAALATLAGVLHAVGFLVPPAGAVAFVALVPLTFALRRVRTWKGALLVGWGMGLTFHLVGYHWFVELLSQFAAASTPVAVAGMVGFSWAQGSLQGVLALMAWGLWRRGRVPLGWSVVTALLVVEFLYPTLFPNYLGNHLAAHPLFIQTADLGGPLLVSALAALVGAGLEELVSAKLEARATLWKLPLAGAVALTLNAGYGAARLAEVNAHEVAAPRLKTAIIQGNVGASDKHTNIKEGIERFRTMTDEVMARGDRDLIVWPESAYNRALKKDVTNLEGKVATEVKTPMIIGTVLREQTGPGKKDRRYWNSALALDVGGGVVGRYDKNVLLAFGEYIPGASFIPALAKLLPYSTVFERGTSLDPLPVGPYKLAANICYEDILASHVRGLMGVTDAGGATPHALVNLTNDSWYGPVEPPIHLALAALRSVEHRRWMIRATATGISAYIDPAGRVRAQSSFERAEVLDYDVPMITGGPTVYARVGDWPGWCAVGVVVMAGVGAWQRRHRQRM